MTTQLDPFQTALLHELREVVTAGDVRPARSQHPGRSGRSGRPGRPVRPPRPAPRRLALMAAAAAVVAGAVMVADPGGAAPAYAVVPGANGSVDVRVDRLEDAAGLQRALREAGVRSEVTYLPEGEQCAEPRYTEAQAPDPEAGFRLSFGGNGYRIQLEPGAIGDDQTLVIAVAPHSPGGVSGQVGVAAGPVSPCDPVPITAG